MEKTKEDNDDSASSGKLIPPDIQRNSDGGGGGGGIGVVTVAVLILYDFLMSFMWVSLGGSIKFLVYYVLELAELTKCCFAVANMFLFSWICHVTGGASYNPLTVLSFAFSGDVSTFFLTLFGRIPAQVIGSIIGVKTIIGWFGQVRCSGPHLKVDIHYGALTEAFLTFTIVTVSLNLKKKTNKQTNPVPMSFFMKTWISSISKLSLHLIGLNFTGGSMNPATALGWAYARDDHLSKEHVIVYWLAPLIATVFAAGAFHLFSRPMTKKTKSD